MNFLLKQWFWRYHLVWNRFSDCMVITNKLQCSQKHFSIQMFGSPCCEVMVRSSDHKLQQRKNVWYQWAWTPFSADANCTWSGSGWQVLTGSNYLAQKFVKKGYSFTVTTHNCCFVTQISLTTIWESEFKISRDQGNLYVVSQEINKIILVPLTTWCCFWD